MKALKTRVGLAALALFGAAAVQAQVETLPPVNNMTVGVYGDFYVYSLELLDKCSAAGDARCLPSGPFPDPSNTATIGNYVLIYKNSQGGSQGNYQLPTGPLSTPQTVDNPFDSLTGVGSSFDMNAAGEPSGLTGNNYGVAPFTPDFAGDKEGTWEASLASINSFLNGQQLYFWFGNNQDGASLDQVQYLWAQVRLTKADGSFVTSAEVGGKATCWELNSTFSLPTNPGSMGTGCDLVNAPYYEEDITKRTPLAAGDFVGTGGAFCVDTTSGESYVPLKNGSVDLPSKDADCTVTAVNSSDGKAHAAGYFISNNLGQNSTEFAAFLPTLNANLSAWAAAGYFMSINFKVRNLNDGGDQLWIRGLGEQTIIIPEPASLALVGLGLLGAVGLSRRRRAA